MLNEQDHSFNMFIDSYGLMFRILKYTSTGFRSFWLIKMKVAKLFRTRAVLIMSRSSETIAPEETDVWYAFNGLLCSAFRLCADTKFV